MTKKELTEMIKKIIKEDDRVIFGGDVKDVDDYKQLIVKRLEYDVTEIKKHITSGKLFEELIQKMFENTIRTKESSRYLLYKYYGEIGDSFSEDTLDD